MISRMIVTGLVVLYLSSAQDLYTAGRTPAAPAQIQQPQPANPSKSLRIFIEEDFSTAQMLKRELTDWSVRIGIPRACCISVYGITTMSKPTQSIRFGDGSQCLLNCFDQHLDGASLGFSQECFDL